MSRLFQLFWCHRCRFLLWTGQMVRLVRAVTAHFPVTACTLGPDILLNILFLAPAVWILPLWWEKEFHADTQNVNYSFVYSNFHVFRQEDENIKDSGKNNKSLPRSTCYTVFVFVTVFTSWSVSKVIACRLSDRNQTRNVPGCSFLSHPNELSDPALSVGYFLRTGRRGMLDCWSGKLYHLPSSEVNV